MSDQESAEKVLTLALALRDAANRAGRRDVAAKAEEAIALLAGVEREQTTDRGNAIVKFLDGLGF